MLKNIIKLYRFSTIYGVRRALFKAAGRRRFLKASYLAMRFRKKQRVIAVIGCGQFSFATIGAILEIKTDYSYKRCFDIDKNVQRSFEDFFDINDSTSNVDEIFSDPKVECVYIASNHASHSDYAIAAIAAKKCVYIEKPVSVNWEQFRDLSRMKRQAVSSIYVGYNRPHSKAIRDLKLLSAGVSGPLTLSFFICGHMIGPDHWYRDPAEGTRVCGNLGHWLDLSVHILSWRVLADGWTITLLPSSKEVPDDNISIVLRSSFGDLITLTLTSRNEPFEGINETVLLQWGDLNAKVDDFRTMDAQIADQKKHFRYWPKDVGHKTAILQPFSDRDDRWDEVRASTALMLTIADMVISGEQELDFSFENTFNHHGL